jgi:hypothetical protein
MKAFVEKVLVVGAIVLGSAFAGARESEGLERGNPVLVDRGSFGMTGAERVRQQNFDSAFAENNFDRALEFASPDDLERIFGAPIDGSARQIRDGDDTSPFNIHIDIDITSYKNGNGGKQNLTIRYPNPEAGVDGEPEILSKTVLVSAGKEGRSNLLVGHCYTVHGAATEAVSAKYGSTMTNPVFFRGRDAFGNGQVFAVHGLLGDGYVNLLGSPASHGCIRVTRENALFIRKTIMKHGMSNTVVCVR